MFFGCFGRGFDVLLVLLMVFWRYFGLCFDGVPGVGRGNDGGGGGVFVVVFCDVLVALWAL